jgi:hypothetical protein
MIRVLKISNEILSYFLEYKYLFILAFFLVLLIIILLKKRIKKNQSFIEEVDIVTVKEKEKVVVKEPIFKPHEVEKLIKPQIKKKDQIIKTTEEVELFHKNIEEKKPKKVKKPKLTIETKFVKEPVIEEIISKDDTTSSKIKNIGFQPTNIFEQNNIYSYPQVLMPKPNTIIKFPRKGRSNKKGYTEVIFFEYLQNSFKNDFQVYNDRHIPSKNGNFVYEPDIVLISEKNGKNIFIDIEIDEPYEGFSRTPTHEVGKDSIRNNFFTNRGWVVIRFSEIQIHQDPKECCYHIAKVIAAIDTEYEIPFQLSLYGDLDPKDSWNSLQAKKWAKEKYREKYLGIENFGERPEIISNYNIEESSIDSLIEENIEDEYKIPTYTNNDGPLAINEHERDRRLRFDPVEHRYFIDGNPDTISASQLIDKFFPEFDSKYWSQIKADERGVDVEVVLEEWETKRNNAANLGTELHEQIENYYNGLEYDKELPEFQYFLNFKERYASMIPYRSEWRIFDEEFLIAGTIDMVYQREGNELYMFDWKRSEKVVDAKGNPKLPSYDCASGELSHLSDNSFNKYAIQQNIYKYILEKRYNKKISSMNLLILHPSFDTYHHIKLPDLTEEVKYIFENSKHYR